MAKNGYRPGLLAVRQLGRFWYVLNRDETAKNPIISRHEKEDCAFLARAELLKVGG